MDYTSKEMYFTAGGVNRLGHLRANGAFVGKLVESGCGNVILFKKAMYNGVLVNTKANRIERLAVSGGPWKDILKKWCGGNLEKRLNITWLGVEPSGAKIEGPTNEEIHGDPLYAIDITEEPDLEPVGDNFKWYTSYPQIVTLTNADATVFSYANTFLDYFQKHRFCGYCGSKQVLEDAGTRLRCLRESPSGIECTVKPGNNLLYPRVDPVVIIALYNVRGQVLLGHNKRRHMDPYMFSCFSGFMEPGESFEQACVREVYEETGIKLNVSDVKLVESQPWPFPANLMVGCVGYVRDADVALRTDLDDELDRIEWFEPAQVEAGRGKLGDIEWVIPPNTSIAGNLIRYCARRKEATKL